MFFKPQKIIEKLFPKSNVIKNCQISDQEYKEKLKELIAFYKSQKGQNDLQILQQIYEEAYKQQLDYKQKRFVKSVKSQNELLNNYSIKLINEKKQLKSFCNKFQEVRGDGNCFYTALGYRFLQILLCEQNLEQFFQFLAQIEVIELPFMLICNKVKIQEENYKSLMYEFLQRLCEMRLIEDKEERLQTLLKHYQAYEPIDDIDGYFFALTTIFFRNVSYYVASKSEFSNNVYDKENLLNWGQECNNNEIIIKELSEFLRVMIVLIYIDKGTVKSIEYCSELHYHQILLLFQPGHYNIGIE